MSSKNFIKVILISSFVSLGLNLLVMRVSDKIDSEKKNKLNKKKNLKKKKYKGSEFEKLVENMVDRNYTSE